jgi:hypothetical protein
MKKDVHISVTEITIKTGKTKGFKLEVDGNAVTIPVDEAVFVNYQNQFPRQSPTPLQRKRFGTLMHLMRAAYQQGIVDTRQK